MKRYILFILLLIFSITSCRKEKNRICEIYDNEHGYTIGKIESSISIPTRTTYSYDYRVDGVNYSSKFKAYGIGQEDVSLIGREFIVVYELNNPSNSSLNTHYRIVEESDFFDYLEEFEEEPPVPNWPRKCKN